MFSETILIGTLKLDNLIFIILKMMEQVVTMTLHGFCRSLYDFCVVANLDFLLKVIVFIVFIS